MSTVVDTFTGQDIGEISINGANMTAVYGTCTRNTTADGVYLQAVMDRRKYKRTTQYEETLECEFDVRDADVIKTLVKTGQTISYLVNWGYDTDSGTGVVEKSSHSAGGTDKQKITCSIAMNT